MRTDFSEIGLIIRNLALMTPAVAVSQSGCTTVYSSCDGYYPQRVETRVVVPAVDGGGADAGLPKTPQACVDFCTAHGAGNGTDTQCVVEHGDGGDKIVVCSFNTVCEGRRPSGYEPPPHDDRLPLLGRYFAAMAAAEAASVVAFERMAAELTEHGMPADLAAGALTAAMEEERHFRMAAALARRFGGRAARGRTEPQPPRTLLDVAIENVREGVVRETFGAVMGHWQAERASERVVRAAMRRIARDEASHAVLSWAVHSSARARLSRPEREMLDEAREDALRETANAAGAPVLAELIERAGVPPPTVARSLMVAARKQLFDRAHLWS